MPLVLHTHPLSSCCQKVLIAIYDTGAPVQTPLLNLGDEAIRAGHRARWPLGKIPLLEDPDTGWVLPETSIIIEHLDRHHAGSLPMLPPDPEARLQARLWDRLCDLYVMAPMQAVVAARLAGDPAAEAAARGTAAATLATAYDLLERRLADHAWLTGETFGLADCAAFPALFYASAILDFGASHPSLAAYMDRLGARPSVARVRREAQPWLAYFPLLASLPVRFHAAPPAD